MRVRVVLQGSTAASPAIDYAPGWHHLRWSLGLRVLDNGDGALINGVGNADSAGGIYVSTIEVDGKPLMDPGYHYLPPRCVLPIRKSGVRLDVKHEAHLPRRRAQWDATGDALAVRGKSAINTGLAHPSDGFFFNRMGPWFPYFSGQPQPGAVSGQGVEFLPGWERNSTYRLLCADHTMHHTALAYVDVATGNPLPAIHQPKYGLSRGYAKETQLAEFCAPASLSPYDDNRVPRDCNIGLCGYKDTITGLNRYNGCLPDDGQHLIRAYRHALAGWQVYADPLCKLYLDLIAGDTALKWGAMPVVQGEIGAPWAGREAGWALHLLKAVQHRGGIALERALHTARMPDSLHQRCAWGLPWGFAPDPWESGYASHADDVAPAIEASIIGYSVDGVAVAEALTRQGNPSHFMRVAPGRCDLDLRQAVERESFNVWACWGKALQVAAQSDHGAWLGLRSRIPAMRLPDDGHSYANGPALLAAMYANPNIGVLAPAIKALESL